MDQYEIRVHQLRKMKFSIYFKLFLIIAALIVAGSLFYYFYDRSFFKISNFEQDNINSTSSLIKKLEIQLKQAANEENYALASKIKSQIIDLKENLDDW